MTDKEQQDKVMAQQPDGEQVELNVFAGVQFIITEDKLDYRMVYNNVSPGLIALAGNLLDKLATRMLNDIWTAHQVREAQQKAQMDAMLASIAGSKVQRAA